MSSIRLRGNTGKWFLPLFAGTQRVNVEYDPGELAGAHISGLPTLFNIPWSNPAGATATITYQEIREETWSPMAHYLHNGASATLTAVVGAEPSTGPRVEFPSYTPAGVRDGTYSVPGQKLDGLVRLPVDSASWTKTGVVATHVGVGDYSPVPGTWTSYSNIAATAGGTTHAVSRSQGSGVSSGDFIAVQAVLRRVGTAAAQCSIQVAAPANFAGTRLRVLYNFNTGAVTTNIGTTTTLILAEALPMPDGSIFLRAVGRTGTAWADATAQVGFADGADSTTFSASGAESIDCDWFACAILEQPSSTAPWLTLGTFSTGGPTPVTGITWTNAAIPVTGTAGYTMLSDFELASPIMGTSASIFSTDMRHTGTTGTVRIAFQPSTGTFYAQVYNSGGTLQAEFSWVPAVGVRQRCVFRCRNNSFSLHVNGVLIGTDVSGTVSNGNFTGGGSTDSPISGHGLLKLYRQSLADYLTDEAALQFSTIGW